MNVHKRGRAREIVSVLIATIVIVGWGVYWGVQVSDVIELLEMAYG